MNLSGMMRLEYQAPRKITGAYHGASHQKLGYIAGVEPLQSRLDHISILWVARSLRTGDRRIREVLEGEAAPEYTRWHDGTGLDGFKVDGPIPGAFYLTPIMDPNERSCGDCQDTTRPPLHYAPMLDPGDERSKSKGYWAGTIGGRMDEGWIMSYTDGTGRKGGMASGAYSEDWSGRPSRTYRSYLGRGGLRGRC